jgi:phosphotransferase system IIB component
MRADQVAGEIRRALRLPVVARTGTAADVPAISAVAHPLDRRVAALRAALGGASNVRHASSAAGRLRLELSDPNQINRDVIARCGARGVAVLAGGVVHLLIDDAAMLAAGLGNG